MNVLVIGSGGREHAIVWKIRQSPKLKKLYVLPGNPGTAALAENVSGISVDDHAAILDFCKQKHIDLVIVGPETPLAAGLADRLSVKGIRCFGPKQGSGADRGDRKSLQRISWRDIISQRRGMPTFVSFDEAIRLFGFCGLSNCHQGFGFGSRQGCDSAGDD